MERWKTFFLQLVVKNISSSNDLNALTAMNLKNHWLSPTLTYVKGSGDVLIEELRKHQQLSSLFIVMKFLRQNGTKFEVLNSEDLTLLKSGLIHSDQDVRLSAFGVLCHCKKKGSIPQVSE